MGESDNAKGGFKTLFRATDNHQTDMDNRASDEQPNADQHRKKNNKQNGSDAQARHHRKGIVALITKKPERLKSH